MFSVFTFPCGIDLASALSGLESATTEWPGLEMWPSGATTLDDARDEVAATLLR